MTKRRRHGVYHEDAVRTDWVTANGERVYDLEPLAWDYGTDGLCYGDLWAIAGPDGLDPTMVDSDHLPAGYHWVESEEWAESIQDRYDQVWSGSSGWVWDNA